MLGGVVSALWLLPEAEGAGGTPTVSPDELKPGMKGYGLTVFRGTKPERFDVEVVGVMKNFRPSQDLILVKTPHPRLNITKNVKGMSGSPIYFKGKLAGAYAYSLSSFQAEPVAGVTPIAPMLAEMNRPVLPGLWPGTSGQPIGAKKAKAQTGAGGLRYEGKTGTYDLGAHAKQARRTFTSSAGAGQITPVSTPLMIGGMGGMGITILREQLEPLGMEPLQAGGAGAAKRPKGAPAHFVDGGSLGVQLARGDVSVMGLGTVTHVRGSKAVGFGHPMLNGGNSQLPTALGDVLWIYASNQHSFKVGVPISPLGALVQDRQSAVVADERAVAPTFPVHLSVKGAGPAPRSTWNSEVSADRFLAPSLTASVIGSAIEATISERRDTTWQLESTFEIDGRPALVLRDFGVAVGGTPDAGDIRQSHLVRAMGSVLSNPWEPVRVQRVTSHLTVSFDHDVLRLRGVELLQERVPVNQPVRLRVRLRSHHGKEETRVFSVRLPAELADETVELEVVPGHEVEPELAAAENLSQLLANLPKASLPPKSLVVQVKAGAGGVAHSGHVTGPLPRFALDALTPQRSTTGPELIQTYSRHVFHVGHYVTGTSKVKVRLLPASR